MYSRSSIQQERLNILGIISTESEISGGLDKILKVFADAKARNRSFS